VSESQIDEIADNVMFFFPLMKRLLRSSTGDAALTPFRNQSYHVLRILQRRGPLPMSSIGSRLYIAKQNMTGLIDRLEGDGLVERKHDPDDRRIVNIIVTGRGIDFLNHATKGMKQIIRRNLSGLSEADIGDFHRAAASIAKVLTALGEEGDEHASN
jgi:DNA-binding MarR family transcriptional regulator